MSFLSLQQSAYSAPAALVLLVGLTACGSPSPDAPMPGHTTGVADSVVSLPAGGVPRAGLAAQEPARQAPTTPTFPLGPLSPQATKPDALITDASRATSFAPDARVQTAASPRDAPPPDEQITADQAQREARQRWFEEVRENPDVTVRLQALELWAEQPGEDMDPLTYALVDEDEQVQARAEELWEQQLTQEAEAPAP
jgi:hypothetical protein